MRPAAAVVAVAAAVATAAGVVGCGPTAGAGPGAASAEQRLRDRPEDGDLLAVVPAGAELVLLLDLAQLRSSPWTRDLVAPGMELAASGPEGGRGFDETADVDLLLLARLPDGESLTVAQGRFDRSRVTAAFEETHPAAERRDFRGCPLLTHADGTVAFLTPRTLISGPLAAVRGAIDASLGRARDVRGERWLSQSRQALAEGRGGVRRRPAFELALRVTEPVRERIGRELEEGARLERLAARVDLGQTLDASVLGTTSTAREAGALAARLDGELRGLRRRRSLAALGLVPVLAAVRLSAPGARVLLDLRLDEAQREQIAERLALAARAMAESARGAGQ